jgi:hypothetical protein
MLGLSLAVNVALAGAGWWRRQHPASLPARETRARDAAVPARPPTEAAPPVAVVVTTNHLAFRWALLESTNYPTYVENLRAFGLPEPLLRDLVASELEELYDRSEPSLAMGVDFWVRGEERRRLLESDRQARVARLREPREVYRSLMGVDWPAREAKDIDAAALANVFGDFLPEDRWEEAMAFAERLEKEAEANRLRADHLLLPADRQRQLELYEGWLAEVTAQLTPAQLEEIQFRTAMLREGPALELLGGIELSGTELRAIWGVLVEGSDPMYEAFAREAGLPSPNPDRTELKDDPARLERVRSLLGPERALALDRNRDPAFRNIRDFVMRRELPVALGVRLYESRQLADQAAAQIRGDPGLAPEERAFQLAEVAAAAELAARQALTADAASAYVEQQEVWLKTLREGAP